MLVVDGGKKQGTDEVTPITIWGPGDQEEFYEFLQSDEVVDFLKDYYEDRWKFAVSGQLTVH